MGLRINITHWNAKGNVSHTREHVQKEDTDLKAIFLSDVYSICKSKYAYIQSHKYASFIQRKV